MSKKASSTGVIKVSSDALELARQLVEHISQHGWASVDVERRDPPSMGAVVAEGLRLLESRIDRKERKR